jgi:hypothetical protein
MSPSEVAVRQEVAEVRKRAAPWRPLLPAANRQIRCVRQPMGHVKLFEGLALITSDDSVVITGWLDRRRCNPHPELSVPDGRVGRDV